MKSLSIVTWAGAVAAAFVAQAAVAGTPLPPMAGSPVAVTPMTGSPIPTQQRDWSAVQQAGYQLGVQYGLPAGGSNGAIGQVPLQGYGPTIPNNYPQTKAGLYPSPVQHAPTWNGQTIITNQAFAPHEMLYPHKYHAMYGPYYYKVHGGFIWTPFGMRTHENWKLQGTEVEVKYHDRIKLFSGFHPPR